MKRYHEIPEEKANKMLSVSNPLLNAYFQCFRTTCPGVWIIKESRYFLFFKRYTLYTEVKINTYMVYNFSYKHYDAVKQKVGFGILLSFFLGYEKGRLT